MLIKDLFEIDHALQSILSNLMEYADENGEISPETDRMIERLRGAREVNLTELAKWYVNLELEEEAARTVWASIANHYTLQIAQAQKKRQWLASVIQKLHRPEDGKLENEHVKISYHPSERLIVEDEKELPECFTETETIVKVDRRRNGELWKYLKSGAFVPGARIEPHYTLKVGLGSVRRKRGAKEAKGGDTGATEDRGSVPEVRGENGVGDR